MSSNLATNKTVVQILDSNLNYITDIRAFVPLTHHASATAVSGTKSGDILQYSKELSDFGRCKFRVSSYDTLFKTYGDILKPHKYHVRLQRNGQTIWQGAIIDNTLRTSEFIEVQAVEYLWYLARKLIRRTSNNPVTNQADGIYRIFSSGSMAQAVTALMNELISDLTGTNHALASLALGTIDNPNYPPNMTDGNNPPNKLTGGWNFGNGTNAPQLTFDYHSYIYVFKAFGNYTYADFGIDNSLKFNFRSFYGIDRKYDVSLVWGEHGNTVDFNLPRLGERQINSVYGIATQNDGTVLHSYQSDQSSIQTNGYLEEAAAYADIKDQATLNARIQAELPLVSTPDAAADTFVLDEQAYPLGLFDVGDIVTAAVNHTAITYSAPKRVVGYSVNVHDTGRELTTVQLNQPLPWQLS